MCRRGRSLDLTPVVLQAELCPGTVAAVLSSPGAGLGFVRFGAALVPVPRRSARSQGTLRPCPAQQLSPGGEKEGDFRHLLV